MRDRPALHDDQEDDHDDDEAADTYYVDDDDSDVTLDAQHQSQALDTTQSRHWNRANNIV